MIEIKNVSYSYSDRIVLDDISLVIKQGEAVALMGANGCGKSTLLKLINGIISPDRGQYFLDGEEVTHKKLQNAAFSKNLHRRIGFVFQNSDAQLFCANVYDEVAFGPRQMGMKEQEVEKRVNDCLDLLHIQELKDRIPYHLSGGEKRKTAIACVMSMNPDVLVLDEPMNGLDPKTQRWLVDFLQKLTQSGKSLVMSTHNLDLVNEITKRAILFGENHTIVADKATESLLEDIELLKSVNLVDQFYHFHGTGEHKHFHDHH